MELELGSIQEEILNQLRNGICEVTFKKVNGEERVMPCTLKAELLPEVKQKDLTLGLMKIT